MTSAPPTVQLAARTKLFVPPALRSIVTPQTEQECVTAIAECEVRERQMQRALRQMSGRPRNAIKKAVRFYCTADCAKVAKLVQELRRAKVEVGKDKFWTARQVILVARALLRWDGPVIGPVQVRPFRLDLKTRPVFRFCHPVERARQQLAHSALRAVAPLQPWAFLYNGGEAAALDWMRKRMAGAKAVLVTDFPSCFALLPWQVVENGSLLSKGASRSLLFDPWKQAKLTWPGPDKPDSIGRAFVSDTISVSNCAHEIGAGRGIPPGAVLSPIVAQFALQDMLTEELLAQFPSIEIGLFADNLVILLPDEKLIAPVLDRLTALATKHFDSIVAHEFRGRTLTYEPGAAFKVLGRMAIWKRGRISFEPLRGHCDRLIERVGGDLATSNFQTAIQRAVGFASRHNGAKAATLTVMRIAHDLSQKVADEPLGHHKLDELLWPWSECN